MILRRLRARVPLLCAIGLLFAGAALATTPITRSEMESFVYRTMASVISLAVLIGSGVIAWLLARDRDIAAARFTDVKETVNRMVDKLDESLILLQTHDASEFSHLAAAKHNHAPMNARLDRIEFQGATTASALHDLRRDHDRINGGGVCQRNPLDSPYPKRASDRDNIDPVTGEPFVRLRGRQ